MPRKVEIDKDWYERLLKAHVSQKQILRIMGTTRDVMERFCREEYGKTFATMCAEDAGRKKKEIKKEQFEELCFIQCTAKEIVGVLGVDEDTLNDWCKREYNKKFSEVREEKAQGGKMSMRRAQLRMAQNNPTMSIWLGKQYLGQKDEKSVKVSKTVDESVREMEAFFNDKDADSDAD